MRITLPTTAPVAKKIKKACEAHGETWQDDYHWLRADNWQEAMRDPSQLPAPIAGYLNAENDYFHSSMKETVELQKKLVAEMRGRMLEHDISLPDRDGPWDYLHKLSLIHI